MQAKEKKHNSEAVALIIELCESDNVEKEKFLQSANMLTCTDYEALVEERTMYKKCGYCLCNNELVRDEELQVNICRKMCTLFDVSKRKDFCSPECYGASEHYKNQLHPDFTTMWKARHRLLSVSLPTEPIPNYGREMYPLRKRNSFYQKNS